MEEKRLIDRYDKEQIRQWIDEAAEAGADKAVANLSSNVRRWIDAAGDAGAEKAILKLYAEIGKAGVRKSLLLLGAVVAAVLSWLGYSGHLPK